MSYLTWGVLQEKVMTHRYGEDPVSSVRFKNSEFLVFMNRIAAFIVAGFYIRVTRSGQWNGPFYRFSFTSLSNICSSWCQYEALRFVSFPTQVGRDELVVFTFSIICLSVVLFVLYITYHWTSSILSCCNYKT